MVQPAQRHADTPCGRQCFDPRHDGAHVVRQAGRAPPVQIALHGRDLVDLLPQPAQQDLVGRVLQLELQLQLAPERRIALGPVQQPVREHRGRLAGQVSPQAIGPTDGLGDGGRGHAVHRQRHGDQMFAETPVLERRAIARAANPPPLAFDRGAILL